MRDLKFCLALDKVTPINWHLALPLMAYILSLGAVGYRDEMYSISNYIGMAVAIYYFSVWLFTQYPIPIMRFWWFVFLIWMVVSGSFTARYPLVVLTDARTMFQILVLVIMIGSYATSLRRVRLMLWSIFISASLPLAGWVLGISEPTYKVGTERFLGGANEPNTLGAFLVVGIACGIILISLIKGKSKIIVIAGIIILCAGLVKTASRGAFVMLMFLFLSGYFYHYLRNVRARYAMVFLGLVFVGFSLTVGWGLLQGTLLSERIRQSLTLFEGSQGTGTGATRLYIAKEAYKYFLNSPIFGIGINNFRHVSGTGMYPHNNFLVILTGTGVIGGILYYIPYFICWYRLKRTKKSISSTTIKTLCTHMQVVILMVFVYGMLIDTWRQKFMACIIGVVFGSIIALNNLIQAEAQFEGGELYEGSADSEYSDIDYDDDYV